MKYSIETTHKFEKSLKKCIKRGLDISKFKEVVNLLATNGTLPQKYKPHKLSGNLQGIWECHISPDWLLLWDQNDTTLTLLLLDTGTHADLF